MKTRLIKSAIPIYIAAGVWIIYGLALPLYRLTHILTAAALSIAAYFISARFFPGRKVEADLASGDSKLDQELKGNMNDLDKLRQANAGIDSQVMTNQIDRMVTAGKSILAAVAEKPSRADQVRKFMKYYLPTSAKLLEQYQTMNAFGAKGEHISKAMKSVENSLGLIADAFEKQLDMIYRDEAVDITSDVQVLETMMAGDGLTSKGIKEAMKEDEKQCQTN
ncbi:MAG: 5-bromo-4-chloroindolyl phosphate hydrolysis family protein [Clostridia bacterium]|nr:5-bromo-4-chloroindolyl phosphate hydrolysis family protein [Clostridia bacterium]